MHAGGAELAAAPCPSAGLAASQCRHRAAPGMGTCGAGGRLCVLGDVASPGASTRVPWGRQGLKSKLSPLLQVKSSLLTRGVAGLSAELKTVAFYMYFYCSGFP